MLLLAGWGQHWKEQNEEQLSHIEELDVGLLQVFQVIHFFFFFFFKLKLFECTILGMIAVQAFIIKVFNNKY